MRVCLLSGFEPIFSVGMEIEYTMWEHKLWLVPVGFVNNRKGFI